MKRRFVILAVLLLAAGLGLIRMAQVQRGLEQRRLVESWTRSLDHYDPTLTQAQNDEVRRAALRSLGRVAVKVLAEDLNYDPPKRNWLRHGPEWLQGLFVTRGDWRQDWRPEEVRRQAAFHLADLGSESAPALGDLLRRAADADSGVQDAVAITLGSISRKSPEIVQALTKMLGSRQARVKFSTAFSLWRLDPSDPAARDRLERLITARNLSWVSVCFWRVGTAGRDFAPALKRAIEESTSTFAKTQAAKALWLMTGDIDPARAVLDGVGKDLSDSTSRRIVRGTSSWKRAEYDLGAAAIILDDIPECRELIRVLLEQVKNDAKSEAREMASVHLARIERLELPNVAPEPAR